MPVRSSLIKISLYALLIITAGLSAISPFLWDYPFELLSNFRVYYLLLAGGIVIAFFICHLSKCCSQLPIYLALALVAFNSAWIFPWYLPSFSTSTDSDNTIRVLTFNINISNTEWDNIATAIREVDPDVATIVESTDETKNALEERLRDRYPIVYRTTGGGLTLLSKRELLSADSKTFDSGTVLTATLQTAQGPVELLAAHPIVPIKPSTFPRRNALLADITTYLADQPESSHILLGDFNLTPWSPYYNRLIKKTGLHNTRKGFGIHPTWLESSPYSGHPKLLSLFLQLPIDHIFVTRDIGVADFDTREAANADHRMVWADLSLSS